MQLELIDTSTKFFGAGLYISIDRIEPRAKLASANIRDVIRDLIASPIHQWEARLYPDGGTAGYTTKGKDGRVVDREYRNLRIWGYWDADKIVPEDYVPCTYFDVLTYSLAEVKLWDEVTTIASLTDILADMLPSSATYYRLALDTGSDKDKESPWTPFTAFAGFMFLDVQNDLLGLIRLGDD